MALQLHSCVGQRAGLLTAVGSLLCAASAIAQPPSQLPAISSKVSTDLTSWGTSVTAATGDFLAVEIDAHEDGSGGWCGMIVDVCDVNATSGDLVPIDTTLNTWVVPMISPNGGSIYASNVFAADAAVGFDVFERAFFTAQGARSETAVIGRFDPLYSPPPLESRIVQQLGAKPHDEWLYDSDGQGYNLDSILQHAVWKRIEETEGGRASDYFGSDAWSLLRENTTLKLTIKILLTRGPDVNPGEPAGPGNMPPLSGWTEGSDPLQFEVAEDNEITFIGSPGSTGTLRFGPGWHGINAVDVGTPGGGVIAGASGYDRGMQLKLVKGATEFVVDVLWVDFGVVGFRIPSGAPLGNYSTKECRYRDASDPTGQTFEPWHTIPQGCRLVIAVQNP